MAGATPQPRQRPRLSMRPWMATAIVFGIVVAAKWLRGRETPGDGWTPEPEPVSDWLPLGLGLE
jgi:hypothetical protein